VTQKQRGGHPSVPTGETSTVLRATVKTIERAADNGARRKRSAYDEGDAAQVEKMRQMVKSGESRSYTAASHQLAPFTKGNSVESTAKRLQRKYCKRYPRSI